MSSQTPATKIASSASVALARVATLASAHQVSTGNCAREQPRAQAPQRLRLLLGAGETLHHRHIAEYVGDALGKIRAHFVGDGLHRAGAADDEVHRRAEDDDQRDEDRAEPPVLQQRQRQQHESATRPAQCSRKNESQTPNIAFEPSIITFNSRPEWALAWKLIGRFTACSK